MTKDLIPLISILLILITFVFWACVSFYEGKHLTKTNRLEILGLIFWPIGLPLFILRGLWNLIFPLFSKEDNPLEKLIDVTVCEYCRSFYFGNPNKCPNCFVPRSKE